MYRNSEAYFSELPSVEISRSILPMEKKHTTTFNVGELIPVFWMSYLPGDTIKLDMASIYRLQTLLTPIMDDIVVDTYAFAVPNRLTDVHWPEIMGENNQSAWIPQTEYTVPYVKYPSGGFEVGTIADYLGVPTGIEVDPVNESDWCPNALPFRAYALICDEWFRSQSVTDPLNIPLGDSVQQGSNGSSYVNDVANGGKPFKVAKLFDLFTSALPSPQKGPPASVAFASIDKYFPVGTLVNDHDPLTSGANVGLHMSSLDGESHAYMRQYENSPYYFQVGSTDSHMVIPSNLYSRVTYSSEVTVSQLRMAFQLQKFLEKNARAGTRYREVLREHFGITVPDARVQIPEYLGGKRIPLSIHQITNNAQSSSADLGDLGAMSNTADVHEMFTKSFSEFGILMICVCARYRHSYSQGLPMEFTKRSKLDYYFPVFANLGETALKKGLIKLTNETESGAVGSNDLVFGYQEKWFEYRYLENQISGEMRPGIANSLATWHLGDYYTSVPSLSDAWIREDKSNVDRVLAVTSSVSNQILADFQFDIIATRPLPVHSIPGLIDHH